jgi:hypothetical protein
VLPAYSCGLLVLMGRHRSAATVSEGAHTLAATGVHRSTVSREVRAGRWQHAAAGVVLTHDRAPTDAELAAVAKAHAGPKAVVTGGPVLRALGVRWVPRRTGVTVLVPEDVRTRSSGLVTVTRTKHFDDLVTSSRWEMPLADPERAVYDEARASQSLRDVRGLVLGAVADGWATTQGLAHIVDRGPRNGSAVLRRALVDAERNCASPPEAELVDGLVGRGVPFLVNPLLIVDGVPLGSPDAYAIGLGLCGEVQSLERHGSDEDEESTYDRSERFERTGLKVLHLSVRLIRTHLGESVDRFLDAARVRRVLAPHRREPARLVVVPRGPVLC